MRINLTKKDLVNSVYMQLGFSKQITENLIEDFLSTIVSNIKNEKKLKLSKFGTFTIRKKKFHGNKKKVFLGVSARFCELNMEVFPYGVITAIRKSFFRGCQ